MSDNKLLAIFISVLCLAGAVVGGITAYQSGKTKQMEIELRIEQEKTKQLQYERADTTIRQD